MFRRWKLLEPPTCRGLYAALLGAALAVLGACDGEQDPQPSTDISVTMEAAAVPDAAGDGGDAGRDAAAADSGKDATLCGGVSCDDKLACTEDLCVASGCLNQVKSGHCVINNTCYKDGDQAAGKDSCHKCDSNTSNKAWTSDVSLCSSSGLACTSTTCNAGTCSTTLLSGYCFIGGACIKQGSANLTNLCQICDTSLSSSSYQSAKDGTSCNDDKLACTNDVCKNGGCTHPLKPGHCKINGLCYYQGELSALQDCRTCNPGKSSSTWSTLPDGSKCSDDGLSCTQNACQAGSCASTIKAGYCKIGKTCYSSGQSSPGSQCSGCVPATSTTNWSPRPDGTACSADSFSCTADTCQAGSCTHKLIAGRCLIGGQCYNSGAAHPSVQCQGCNPASSTSNWSQLPDGSACPADPLSCTDDVCQQGSCVHPLKAKHCRINGACYQAGTQHPTQSCFSCNPQNSTVNWSVAGNGSPCDADAFSCTDDVCQSGSCAHPLKNGHCLINNQCFGAGQLNPANPCLSCVPGSSATAWTQQPNGFSCGAGKCFAGSCCLGCVIGTLCQPGLSPSACGKGGSNCAPCITGWSCIGGSCTQQSVEQSLDVGPFASKFSSSLTRGFWFTAPTSFTIVGLRVPLDVGSDPQNIQVVRMNTAPSTIYGDTPFTTLAYYSGMPGTGYITVNIAVQPGQHIGILGARGSGSTMHNSYGASSPYKSYLKGHLVSLTRFIHQDSIGTSPADKVASSSGSIGRVEVRYK